MISRVVKLIYNPTSSVEVFFFLLILFSTLLLSVFLMTAEKFAFLTSSCVMLMLLVVGATLKTCGLPVLGTERDLAQGRSSQISPLLAAAGHQENSRLLWASGESSKGAVSYSLHRQTVASHGISLELGGWTA